MTYHTWTFTQPPLTAYHTWTVAHTLIAYRTTHLCSYIHPPTHTHTHTSRAHVSRAHIHIHADQPIGSYECAPLLKPGDQGHCLSRQEGFPSRLGLAPNSHCWLSRCKQKCRHIPLRVSSKSRGSRVSMPQLPRDRGYDGQCMVLRPLNGSHQRLPSLRGASVPHCPRGRGHNQKPPTKDSWLARIVREARHPSVLFCASPLGPTWIEYMSCKATGSHFQLPMKLAGPDWSDWTGWACIMLDCGRIGLLRRYSATLPPLSAAFGQPLMLPGNRSELMAQEKL